MRQLQDILHTWNEEPEHRGKKIPLDQINLPEGVVPWEDLSFEKFAELFCAQYGLSYYLEKDDSYGAKIGIQGLHRLFSQYKASHRQFVLAERRRVNRKIVLTILAFGGLTLYVDEKAGCSGMGEDTVDTLAAWYDAATGQPYDVPYVAYRRTGIRHVDTNDAANVLTQVELQWLNTCKAVGYVLTECEDGEKYTPHYFNDGNDVYCDVGEAPYYYKHGECGERFVALESYRSNFSWKNVPTGEVDRITGSYGDKYVFNPISPASPELCAKEEAGVFLAPIVVASRDQDLPISCFAEGIDPVSNTY